ncbi:hypothetical protein D3C72_922250 [compost metagenome]
MPGELAAEQASGTDEQRRRSIRPPRAVRPEVGHTGTIHRHLVKAERGDIEDVVEVADVAHAEVDEQVVHQHHQQHAVDHPQHIQARGLLLHVGLGGPQRQRRLHRALAVQAQVGGGHLARRQLQLEQIVVLQDLPTLVGQGVAGAPGQAVTATAVGQVQLEVVQRRIGQFQQPLPWGGAGSGDRAQFDLEPEHRGGITGVQHVFVVGAKMLGEPRGTDLGDAGAAIEVFINLHGLAQRKMPRSVVEIDRPGQHGQQAQKHNQQIAHTAPAWPVRSSRGCLPSV